MAVDIIVQRAPADSEGEDILDPLMSTVAVALERGRNEIDFSATGKIPVKLQTVYRSGVRLGQLAEVTDSLQGIVFRGKIIGIAHQISGQGAITLLTVEKVQDF